MPRYKSLRCVETILFFGLFILVGHLGINFWERYMIQNEVNSVKFSLHKLKETIINIGRTYDNLESELKGIMKIVEINHAPRELQPKRLQQRRYEALRCKDDHNLDRRTLHDIQVHAALKAKHHTKAKLDPHNKITELIDRKDEATGPLGKNATTITMYPLKSVGVTSNLSKYEILNKYYFRDKDTINSDTHRCYRQRGYWNH